MEEENNMGKTHDGVFVGILTSNDDGDGNNFYQQSFTIQLFNFLLLGLSKEGKSKNFPPSNIRQPMSGVAKNIWNQTLETLLMFLLAKEEICESKLGESKSKLMISTNLQPLLQ